MKIFLFKWSCIVFGSICIIRLEHACHASWIFGISCSVIWGVIVAIMVNKLEDYTEL